MPILADPVLSALKIIGNRLNAVVVCDTSDSQYNDYRDINGENHVYMVYPKVKVLKDGSIGNTPSSAMAAGIMAGTPFWQSPSNRVANGVLGTSVPVSFGLDDPSSLGQILNSKQISTFVQQDGIRLWGSRGTGDKTDLKTNFIHKVRIRNAIREAIITSHRWAVAMNITKGYFKSVTDSVNGYFSNLQTRGAIAGGECYVEASDNPPEQILDGEVHFTYEYTPSPVSEKLVFKEQITDKYLENIGA